MSSRILAACLLLALAACTEEREGRTPVVRRDAGLLLDAAAHEDAATEDAATEDAANDAGESDATSEDAAGATDAETFADAESFPDAEPFADAQTFPDAALPDAGGAARYDVTILVDNFCNVTATPASIGVPMGTAFTVNWINSGASDSEVDIAKIDQFNQVPIVIGLEVGNSYHDNIREWCGAIFTGTFSFRITGCFDPYYLDVDCAI